MSFPWNPAHRAELRPFPVLSPTRNHIQKLESDKIPPRFLCIITATINNPLSDTSSSISSTYQRSTDTLDPDKSTLHDPLIKDPSKYTSAKSSPGMLTSINSHLETVWTIFHTNLPSYSRVPVLEAPRSSGRLFSPLQLHKTGPNTQSSWAPITSAGLHAQVRSLPTFVNFHNWADFSKYHDVKSLHTEPRDGMPR
ncbi:hypothetical protein GE21DRAFT_1316156 [Neurospora crassa]|nr:hypothetical protein GE21DRAFT_1316156 [Neurospora crassa]